MTDIKTKEVNGTSYHEETAQEVIDILERSRHLGVRLRVHYGDVETGQDWGDTHDVTGYIGRTMGPIKVPLLLFNRRSMGGGAILDHCIIRIRFANKQNGGDLYCHPNYKEPVS